MCGGRAASAAAEGWSRGRDSICWRDRRRACAHCMCGVQVEGAGRPVCCGRCVRGRETAAHPSRAAACTVVLAVHVGDVCANAHGHTFACRYKCQRVVACVCPLRFPPCPVRHGLCVVLQDAMRGDICNMNLECTSIYYKTAMTRVGFRSYLCGCPQRRRLANGSCGGANHHRHAPAPRHRTTPRTARRACGARRGSI